MATFHFELVSPERVLFSGEVNEVVVPGSEGEFTVLRDHAPLMTTLRPGIVTVADNCGSSGRLRDEFDVLPPGDLRQALAALCGDDDWGRIGTPADADSALAVGGLDPATGLHLAFSSTGPSAGGIAAAANWSKADSSSAGTAAR